MTFAEPKWLAVGLAVVFALSGVFYYSSRRREVLLSTFAARKLLGKLVENVSLRRRVAKQLLFLSAVYLLFCAVARPQAGFNWEEVHRKGIDLLFAIDTSKSMLAQDVAPNRLKRSELGVADFVAKLDGDRVGLIPFAGQAFLLCPLTLDYDAFLQSLSALDTATIPLGGTNIASAITVAKKALSGSSNQKILILITDGEDLAGEALDAAKDAAEEGLTIYTVGVGTSAGELIPLANKQGVTSFVKDGSGQVVKSRLDQEMLQKIAEAAQGTYQPLGNQAQGLEQIYQERLKLLPQTELAERMRKVPIERFGWPVFVALILLITEFSLSERKRAFFQKPNWIFARVVKPQSVLIALFLLTSARDVEASPRSAEEAYIKGKYGEALEEYNAALLKKPGDYLLQYNRGAAAYKSGDYAQAEEAFSKTLGSQELSLQAKAYYNLGNVLFRQGQASEQTKPEVTIRRWESALKSYQGTLQLKPKDENAQANFDYVKKKLDELKQKQEKEQKDKQQKSQEQKQVNEEQQRGGKQSSQENSQKDKEQQQSSDQSREGETKQSQQSEQRDDQRQSAEKEGEQQQGKDMSGQNADATDSQKGLTQDKGEQKKGEADKQEQQIGTARREEGELSKEEAEMLLDSMKGEEAQVQQVPGYDRQARQLQEKDIRDW